MTEAILDAEKFESWTDSKYRNEEVEIFKCPGYKLIFIGLPDSHVCLIDPINPSKKAQYSLPSVTKYPKCFTHWQDKNHKWRTEATSIEELAASSWSWLLRQK